MLRIVLIVVAGIVALDVAMVGGLAILAALARRRALQQAGARQALLASDPRLRVSSVPVTGSRPWLRRSLASAVVVATAVAAVALVSPTARQSAGTMLGSVARGLGLDPSDGVRRASAPRPDRSVAGRPAHDLPSHSTAATGGASASSPGQSGSPTQAASSGTHAAQTPTAVTAVPDSTTEVRVAWADVANESGYRIERSTDGATGWVTVATTATDVTMYADDGLEAGTTYYYRVTATTPSGDLPSSDVASATTAMALASPPGVTAAASSPEQIEVSWQDVANEAGYRIERSANGVDGWVTIATTGQDVVGYSDAGLAGGATFYYRVTATSGAGDSAPSDVASASTPDATSASPASSTATP